jgi:hypothetical protein
MEEVVGSIPTRSTKTPLNLNEMQTAKPDAKPLTGILRPRLCRNLPFWRLWLGTRRPALRSHAHGGIAPAFVGGHLRQSP